MCRTRMPETRRTRRQLLLVASGSAVGLLAGCSDPDEDDEADDRGGPY